MIQTFYFNELRTCCYVVWDAASKECVVIDPGCFDARERQRLLDFVKEQHLKVKYILTTHCHFDHIMGLQFAADTFQAPVLSHPMEANNLKRLHSYCSVFGFDVPQPTVTPQPLQEGDTIQVGSLSLHVLHTPGHSPGSVCFYEPGAEGKDGILFCGDTLFQGSVGRTDLPGGDYDALMASFTKHILPLPDGVTAYPGHGPCTTIGQERLHNPYLQ